MVKNPGLTVFAADFIRSPSHPLNIDPLEDDPELEHSDDNNSDYMPPASFGRWRTPGQSIRVPVKFGPPYGPGESPDDVVYGELLDPVEKDGADKILNGEHESDRPSANPYVEHARQDLKTPGSDVAVSTLSSLLGGAHPDSMSHEDVEAAHQWLSQRFTGVRVNPSHGTLEAASPSGMQLMRRHSTDLAVPETAKSPTPSFSLTNKHGTFESPDPKRLVRAMVAFQIMHNEVSQHKKKDEDQDQTNNGLGTTSASLGDIGWAAKHVLKNTVDYLRPSTAPGFQPSAPKPPKAPSPTPLREIPSKAVFEPGSGTDANDGGVRGGYVAHDEHAPAHWRRDKTGVAYSPGHQMNVLLDPAQATKPRSDPYFNGHTFTYSPNEETGHTVERYGQGLRYFVNKLHPAARNGLDVPPRSPASPYDPRNQPAPAGGRPSAPRRPSAPPPPRAEPEPPRAEPLPAPHGPRPARPTRPTPIDPPRPSGRGGRGRHRSSVTSSNANDLCPVCVSGYLEPYDGEHHECLNCGSLVKHVGFEKQAARAPLGRGLSDIPVSTSDPLGLAFADSDNSDESDQDAPSTHHPLYGQQPDSDYIGYEAPRAGILLDKQSGLDSDPGDLDKSMGKMGYQPLHKPGDLHRAYVAPLPGTKGAYARVTEGTNGGWMLTTDAIHSREPYTQNGVPFAGRSIPMDRHIHDPAKQQQFRSPLTDPQNRSMGEKTILATGHHPIDDDHLNRSLRDLAENGRNAEIYTNMLKDSPNYIPPALPPTDPQATQKQKRMLSSVNPGLARFTR